MPRQARTGKPKLPPGLKQKNKIKPLSLLCERGFCLRFNLFHVEGLAVGALIHSGIALVSADKDLVQSAVVVFCVMTAA